MCGRYTSTSAPARLAETFVVDEVKAEELPVRYNVAPTQPVYAVAESKGPNPRRILGTFRWGLVPSWAKDPSIGNKMINARAESVATKNAYKRALAARRCIIPADAFYEWQVERVDGQPARSAKAAKTHKVPFAIGRRDGEPLAFAGLWEVWHSRADPGAEPLRTCVIITTQANELLAPIHDRMPVVLPSEAWAPWLDPTNTDVEQLQPLLGPAPAGDLELWPVSTRVNSSANEGPDLLEPLGRGDPG